MVTASTGLPFCMFLLLPVVSAGAGGGRGGRGNSASHAAVSPHKRNVLFAGLRFMVEPAVYDEL